MLRKSEDLVPMGVIGLLRGESHSSESQESLIGLECERMWRFGAMNTAKNIGGACPWDEQSSARGENFRLAAVERPIHFDRVHEKKFEGESNFGSFPVSKLVIYGTVVLCFLSTFLICTILTLLVAPQLLL